MKAKATPKGIVFIRNSDVRHDTRLRKAISVAIDCEMTPLVLGWIRDGAEIPNGHQDVNGRRFIAQYYNLGAKFGGGMANLGRLVFFNLWLLKTLIIKRHTYSVIYACDLDAAIPAVLLKLLSGKKIIYDIFDFYSHTHAMPNVVRRYVEKLEYSVCRISDSVIVCTEKRQKILHEKTAINGLVVYNTPDLTILPKTDSSRLRGRNRAFNITYVGTLSSSGRLLKEVIDKIKEANNIELHIGGLGPLEKYIINTAATNTNIHYHGQLTNVEALELQSDADVLFATYDPAIEINRNSAPNKLYEAMALGKPIIVCRGTDADITVSDGRFGCAIEYDADQFMEVVLKYQNNVQLKEAEGARALDLYRETYSWTKTRDSLIAVFSDM